MKNNKYKILLTEGELIIISKSLRGFGYIPSKNDKELRDLYGKDIISADDKMTKKLAHIFDLNEMEKTNV